MIDLLADLTEPQRQAVTHTDGPLLVLAGAGSGKTRVITRRVANLVRLGVAPGRIVAITFTNKAAGEMRERLAAMSVAGEVNIGTFHSFCARLLREYASEAGLSPRFSIFDTADRRQVIRDAVGKLNLDASSYAAAAVETAIGSAKNKLLDAEEFARTARDPRERDLARIYRTYEEIMRSNAALDFDDLLLWPARLLRSNAGLRDRLEERFTHVLIDEYQDTNHAQYVLVRQLTATRKNLAVVGDPDQSVYAWRGADINNILQFESDFPDATVIRLEQNYRSTQTILKVADELIRHNRGRKPKSLWTANEVGLPVRRVRCSNEYQEAEQIAHLIAEDIKAGQRPGDVAVFYRVNSLTRVLEGAMRTAGLPYELVRGVEFFNRQEIKDALSYLRVLANPADSLSLERIINVPPRGIGETTIRRLRGYAAAQGLTLLQALENPRAAGVGRSVGKVEEFRDLLAGLAPRPGEKVRDLLDRVIMRSRLWHYYASQDTEETQRIANLNELLTAAAEFDATHPDGDGNLVDFLAIASLTGDQDGYDPAAGKVTLMTLHSAKGLEFPVVYIAGLEQGLLPHQRAIDAGDIEEERRLLFVGITRAMKSLTLTHAQYRSARGESLRQMPSEFLSELPQSAVAVMDLTYAEPEDRLGKFNEGGELPPDWLPRTSAVPSEPDLQHNAPSRPPRAQFGVRHRLAPAPRFDVGTRGPPTASGSSPPATPTYQTGQKVRHPVFGVGHITSVETGWAVRLRIRFPGHGEKTIIAGYVRLDVV